jgi:small-conductance mechanosensitive channel
MIISSTTLILQAKPVMPGKIDAAIARLNNYWMLVLQWIEGHWVEMLVAIALAIALFAILSWLRHVAARYVSKSGGGSALSTIIARAVARTSRFFRLMLAAELVNDLSNAPPQIEKAITILFTIALAVQVAIWVREIILGLIERRLGNDSHPHETLTSAIVLIRWLVSIAIFAIAALVVLDNLGINITGLVAGLGVGGIAIGLAAQGIFADLFAAIAIIFDKPFVRGDTIKFDTTTANVESIGMKSTRLRALSGEEVIIANRLLLDKELVNFSRIERRRITFNFGLVYRTSPEKALDLPALLEKTVNENEGEFLRCGFTGFGASALDFELLFDIHSQDFVIVAQHRHRIGLSVYRALTEAGYELAYPTQTTFTAAPDGTMIMPYAQPATPGAARSSNK